MSSANLLCEISIKKLSDLALMGKVGPAIESTRMYRYTKKGRGANCIGCLVPRQDFLPNDGAQGTHEVVEGPGFGTQRLLLIVEYPVDPRTVESSV